MIYKKLILSGYVLLFMTGFNYVAIAQQQNVLSKDETKINFHAEGKGEPVLVFVHGWSCDKSYWNDQVKAFSPKYKVVAIDLAGHGESGSKRKDYTMELFGEDVVAVVNKLKLDKVILIGHSMGGYVIIEAAQQLKEKVIGLIGADTYQSFKDDWTAEQKEGFLKPFTEKFVDVTNESSIRSIVNPLCVSTLTRLLSGLLVFFTTYATSAANTAFNITKNTKKIICQKPLLIFSALFLIHSVRR